MTAPTLISKLNRESLEIKARAKLLDIGAGTNEIRRMLIGRELIGAAG